MGKYLRFDSIVAKNEFRALRGSGFRSVIYLSCILYITFLCIGFSNNALRFQDRLAMNPFSNWVNIAISKSNRDSVERLAAGLEDTVLRSRFFIRDHYLSKEFGASFLDREGACTGLPMPKVRTTDPGSPVTRDLLGKDNLIRMTAGNPIFGAGPYGFIVTGSLLKRLGFYPDSVSWLSYRLYGGKFVPVAILAVVKELPDHADLVCTDAFYSMQLHNYPDDPGYLKLFIETRDPRAVRAILTEIRKTAGLQEDIPVPDSIKGFNGSLHVLYFPPGHSGIRDLFSDNLKPMRRLETLRKVNFGAWYDVIPGTGDETAGLQNRRNLNYDYLSVEFVRLDRISDFSAYIRDRYRVSVNMETLTQRQNYLFSLNISLGAVILVLILAALSVVLFISSTLKNHLDRVRRNLGNFLAFGTGPGRITAIYIVVVAELLLVSTAIAFVTAWISGELFDRYLLRHLLILEGDQNYFSMFNPWLTAFITGVFLVAIAKTLITVSFLVRQPPGDLIYERVNR